MQTENYRFIHLLHSISLTEFEKSYDLLVGGGWLPLGNPVFGMGKQNEHYLCQFATNRMHDDMVTVLVGDEKTRALHEGAPDSNFHIGKYLVTIAHWDHVRHWAIQNGYDLPEKSTETHGKLSHSQAVSGVSFYEACKWCNAKSEMEGLEPVYKIWREDDPRTTKLSDFAKHITFRAGTPDEDENMEDFTDKSGYRLPSKNEWEWGPPMAAYSRIPPDLAGAAISTKWAGNRSEARDSGWEKRKCQQKTIEFCLHACSY